MDSIQLRQAVEFIIGDNFYFNILQSHELPSMKISKDRTSFIVIHKGSTDSDIGHFILFECTYYKRNYIYIDSYGLDPLNYLDFLPFKITYKNRRQLQDSSSDLCGWYLVFYIYCRAYLKLPVHHLLDFFSADTKSNDKKIRLFAANLMKRMNKNPHTTKCSLKAMCMCEFISCMTHHAV